MLCHSHDLLFATTWVTEHLKSQRIQSLEEKQVTHRLLTEHSLTHSCIELILDIVGLIYDISNSSLGILVNHAFTK